MPKTDQELHDFNATSTDYFIIRQPFKDDGSKRTEYMAWHMANDMPVSNYVRLRTLGLCAEILKKENIDGDLAEVGVFKGSFARALSGLFPDRKLYLYDTFSGYDDRQVAKEPNAEQVRQKNWYKNINKASASTDLVEHVNKILPHPEKAIFRKGLFPDTARDESENDFALVSIDVTLYQPTLDALYFFYPLLVKGGYIFVNDGNFKSIQRAVEEFRENYFPTPPFVPLCDRTETFVFTK